MLQASRSHPKGRVLAVALVAATALVLAPPSGTTASFADVARDRSMTCTDGSPTADGRVFPEPMAHPHLISFEHFVCGMVELEQRHPTLLESEVLGRSEGGHDQYVVRMTNEETGTDKPGLLVYSSIHGGETGGREGAVRQIEDLVEPAFLAGEDWVVELLDRFVVHWFFPNPDGWANCEGGPSICSRGNANGTDLNRNYPITGFIAGTPLSEVESRQAHDYILDRAAEGWYLGTDNHGQGPDTYAAAGLQIVGQFDYQKSETLARFADGINAEMGASNAVLAALEQLNGETGLDMGAYHWGTLYDMLGYSASGSMIDWFNTPGGAAGVGFATELTAGAGVRQELHPGPLNQVHVDSIRAINTTMFKQALDPVDFTYELTGDVGYVFDPRRIRHDDADGRGYDGARAGSYDEEPYDVSRMAFFEDLAEYADRRVAPVRVPDVLAGTTHLQQFDSLVLANDAMPEGWVHLDADGAPTEPEPEASIGADEAWWAELASWVEEGGNLVVTDAAIADALPRLGIVEQDNVHVDLEYVGSVPQFTDRDHPLNAGLRGVASQTYDTVPLGMAFGTPDSAPNWKVDRGAWEAAGGFTAGAHVPNDPSQLGTSATVYGEVPYGEGRVRILGALLPDPTEEFFHPFGLQNYAVTYTGYTLLQNMLDWDNPAQAILTCCGPPSPPEPDPGPPPLPVSGGGVVAGGLAVVGLGLVLRRR